MKLVLFDDKGEMLETWDVSMGIPKGIGWNLSVPMGRQGLLDDIVREVEVYERENRGKNTST